MPLGGFFLLVSNVNNHGVFKQDTELPGRCNDCYVEQSVDTLGLTNVHGYVKRDAALLFSRTVSCFVKHGAD